jgi:butyrate kinase
MYRILVINPGSTTTKLALYENEIQVWQSERSYSPAQLSRFRKVLEQFEMRYADMLDILKERGVEVSTLSAVVSRGGPFKPLDGGTHSINQSIVGDVLTGRVQFEHASMLGVALADRFLQDTDIPGFFVDPVSVDEFEPVARISGLPNLERKSLVHALNIRAAAWKVAIRLNKDLNQLRFVMAHLGGGISICPLKYGRIVDVNNSVEGGPFSPERSGSLPVSSLVGLCYSGSLTESEMKRKIAGLGGLTAHLGTNDAREVEKRIAGGDSKAETVYRAMAYQIAKEIGAMATVLNCMVDGIVLTGGLARSAMLTSWIRESVQCLAPVFILPGEFEMEALALGALRVLRGEEKPRSYKTR